MATEKKKIEAKPSAKVAVKSAKPKVSAEKTAKAVAPRVTEVRAMARFVHVAPRKVRLVTDLLRGKAVTDIFPMLQFVRRDATRPVVLLLKSAVANAEHNFQIDEKDLFVKQITVDEGPKLKRYRPRAHGSASAIRYRMSHIALTLGVRPGAKAKAIAPKKEVLDDVKVINPDDVKKDSLRSDNKDQGTTTGKRDGKGFMKGVFQRKTG